MPPRGGHFQPRLPLRPPQLLVTLVLTDRSQLGGRKDSHMEPVILPRAIEATCHSCGLFSFEILATAGQPGPCPPGRAGVPGEAPSSRSFLGVLQKTQQSTELPEPPGWILFELCISSSLMRSFVLLCYFGLRSSRLSTCLPAPSCSFYDRHS